ncbi:AraC family transcriptional regulator [Motiliproteus sediminis]|uniref:AraC family transcriptional regulator n=1 Tax=Motiliproteus sediminis TaxID=1468178 RepID=UPI001AEF6E25|nr:AraC family transcriptional regulator [Motiliproteus sediminis]
MSLSTTTVPSSYVLSLVKLLEAQGTDPQPLLEAAEIEPQELERAEIEAKKYSKLYQKSMLAVRDEYFGMPSGGRVPNGTFRMMCLCIIHCKTLGQAVQRCSEFHEISRGSKVKPVLEQRGRSASIGMGGVEGVDEEQFAGLMSACPPAVIRTGLSAWHHFLCWLAGRRVELTGVDFSFPKPDDAADYEVLFQAPIRFAQARNQLRLESGQLELPLVQTEESLEGFLKTAPYQLLVMVDGDNSLKSRVQAIIGRDFSREMPSAEAVAKSLNMSVTTLRRRLQSENTSFQKIKDECRREAATNYLSYPDLSNNDIAALMGFDETSAFFRSFKKWTGMTPGDYRRSVL